MYRHGHRQHAFLLQPPRRRIHLQPRSEFHRSHLVHPPRNIRVFAIERDRRVEPANLHQRIPPQHKIPALHHRPGAQHPSVHRIHQERDRIENLHAPALRRRQIVVDKRPAQRHHLRIARKVLQHRLHPTRGQPRIRVDIRNQLARTRRKASLPRKRQPFAHLLHHAHARITERNLARPIRTRIVDDDDLNLVAQLLRLRQNRLQTSRKISLFVVRRHHKA